MKNKFLKIFCLIIVFMVLIGTTQVNATLKTFTGKPSYWNGLENNGLSCGYIKLLIYCNQDVNQNNALINVSWHKNFSEWGNEYKYQGWAPECMVFLNQYFKNVNVSDLIKEIGNNSEVIEEYDAFLEYFENFISKSGASANFLGALEDVPKNEFEKYNTDGADGFTQSENKEFYTAYIVKYAEEFCKDVRYSIQKMHIGEGKTYKASDGKTVKYGDDINTKKNYTKAQIQEYIKQYGEVGIEAIKNDKTCLANWEKSLGKTVDKYNSEELEKYIEDTTGKKISEIRGESKKAQEKVENKNEDGYAGFEQGQLYHLPDRVAKNDSNSTNLDQIIDGADKFMNSATKNEIESDAIQNLSNTIYNILLVVGIIIAIIIGAVIGIMFITGSVEQKADVKKLLIPYIVGCVVVFGSFAIWKIAVTMFSGM